MLKSFVLILHLDFTLDAASYMHEVCASYKPSMQQAAKQ
jgi:hypothetical protein